MHFEERRYLHDVPYGRSAICAMRFPSADAVALRASTAIGVLSPNGGPIALALSKSERPSPDTGSFLNLYTSGGTLLKSVKWRGLGSVVFMEWLEDELLLTIGRSGAFVCLSAVGEVVSTVQVNRQNISSRGGVVSAAIHAANGWAILYLGDGSIVGIVGGFFSPLVVPLANVELKEPPTCMQLLPLNGVLTALIATEGGQLLLVDQQQCVLLPVTGPFVALPLSPSGGSIALVGSDSAIRVYTTQGDFSVALDEARLPQRWARITPPILWVGEDCLGYHTTYTDDDAPGPSAVVIGGPKNGWLRYTFESPVLLVSEIDGLRVVASDQSWFIGRLPPEVVSCQAALSSDPLHGGSAAGWPSATNAGGVAASGDSNPAALLLKAESQFAHSSPLVNETAELLMPSLPEAIDTCIKAAESTSAWNALTVTKLLQAASFGKKLLYDHAQMLRSSQRKKKPAIREGAVSLHARLQRRFIKKFARAIRDLRVVMALKSAPVEMCLTTAQFRALTVPRLMKILARRQLHLLAVRIGEWCGLQKRYSSYGTHHQFVSTKEIALMLNRTAAAIYDGAARQNQQSHESVENAIFLRTSHEFVGGSGMHSSADYLSSVGLENHSPNVTAATTALSSAAANDPVEFVLSHWIKRILREKRYASTELVFAEIEKITSQYGSPVDPLDAAAFCANKLHRPDLAERFLELEPRASVKVQGFLALGCASAAIEAAAAAGDCGLTLHSMLSLLHSSTGGWTSLASEIIKVPSLWGLIRSWCLHSDSLVLLTRLSERRKDIRSAGWVEVFAALDSLSCDKAPSSLAHAAGFFGSCLESSEKSVQAVKQICLAHVELLQEQQRLVKSSAKWAFPFHQHNVGQSLADTVKLFLKNGKDKEAADLAASHNVTEQRVHKWKVQELLDQESYDEVVKFACTDCTNIGVSEFVGTQLQMLGKDELSAKVLAHVSTSSGGRLRWNIVPSLPVSCRGQAHILTFSPQTTSEGLLSSTTNLVKAGFRAFARF